MNVDWLRLKWYFLGFSVIFSVAGIVKMSLNMAQIHSPVPLGVDFEGGTQVRVQFQQTPDLGKIRQATAEAGMSRVYGGFILKIRVWWGRWRVGRFANWLLRNLMKLK